ncbi:MAG: hypothetical protein JWN45_3411 [Acidobacteriaceae bacterium]|nr:hypothetical protein [Acidobacteriaceae bacterium]
MAASVSPFGAAVTYERWPNPKRPIRDFRLELRETAGWDAPSTVDEVRGRSSSRAIDDSNPPFYL